jgi:hypothetical protein
MLGQRRRRGDAHKCQLFFQSCVLRYFNCLREACLNACQARRLRQNAEDRPVRLAGGLRSEHGDCPEGWRGQIHGVLGGCLQVELAGCLEGA